MLIAEMVKVAAFQLLEGGDVSTKGLMELSRAVATSVGAQKTSAEHRSELEAEVDLRLKKADEAVETVGGAPGKAERKNDGEGRRGAALGDIGERRTHKKK